ncbi:hypothetical protein BpHYR1_032110 [Brachionus plicatilis]|uniref:Uncharacterized protein n=1 Tax=Brachionus plicatilis TaxID=10195 RepID=A0A3M7RCI9_BRAPC|nr:hypothetical protein BpHYR1_032110 [Brachionus plicatilis]
MLKYQEKNKQNAFPRQYLLSKLWNNSKSRTIEKLAIPSIFKMVSTLPHIKLKLKISDAIMAYFCNYFDYSLFEQLDCISLMPGTKLKMW